ncbi:MAG: carbamoyltransferase C-terminal domain-containing protein [Pseudonocardiaceae bacterium]
MSGPQSLASIVRHRVQADYGPRGLCLTSAIRRLPPSWPNTGSRRPGATPPDRTASIPAVVHVDGTARPQAVRRETNQPFWEPIAAFRQVTGVLGALNTSFNLAGSPIVNSPRQAVDTFLATELDAPTIGPYLANKRVDG